VAVLAGVAPVGLPGFDFFKDETPLMRDEMLAALEGPQALLDFLDAIAKENPVNPFAPVLTDGDTRESAQIRTLSESLIQALGARDAPEEDGYVDDMRALAAPWGFDIGSIGVPVRFFQGMDDLMVPPAHAQWLCDHVPGASLELRPGQGHMVQPLYAEALAWLLAP
jgi:pimeloyl-ACP methyl ester carboxylesterase